MSVRRQAGGRHPGFIAVILFVLGLTATAQASGLSPWPPCPALSKALPVHAALDAPPSLQVWRDGAEQASRLLPPCGEDWNLKGASTMVALAGRFRHAGSAEALVARIARVSRLNRIRYWSTTRQRWRRLIENAEALQSPDRERPRADFEVAEVRPGSNLFFRQISDNLGGDVLYRVRPLVREPRRLIFSIENAEPIRYLMLPGVETGDSRLLHVLEQENGEVWRHYLLLWLRSHPLAQAFDPVPSLINRAAAFYRHVSGLPTDAEPPAAP